MVEGFFSQNSSLDGQVHFLEVPDDYVSFVLCFPRSRCDLLDSRLKVLVEDGFIYLLETGTRVLGRRVVGKGYTGITAIALHRKHGIGALKLLRLDSRRRSLEHEAKVIELVQNTGLAPRIFLHRDFYIFRDYIPVDSCSPVPSLLETLVTSGRVAELKALLRRILIALYNLDSLKVDHTELGRPGGHLFYCLDGPKILDWDSARISNKPTNLSSFVSYLVYRFKYAKILRDILKYDTTQLIYSLKNYKGFYGLAEFTDVLRALGLEQ